MATRSRFFDGARHCDGRRKRAPYHHAARSLRNHRAAFFGGGGASSIQGTTVAVRLRDAHHVRRARRRTRRVPPVSARRASLPGRKPDVPQSQHTAACPIPFVPLPSGPARRISRYAFTRAAHAARSPAAWRSKTAPPPRAGAEEVPVARLVRLGHHLQGGELALDLDGGGALGDVEGLGALGGGGALGGRGHACERRVGGASICARGSDAADFFRQKGESAISRC